MKFSILITSYNKEKYLNECINSCLDQKYKDLEIILMDNYSNDNTNEILEKYKNEIKIFLKKKISDFSALNQIDLIKEGLNHCSGDIICLLDADDYFINTKIIEIKKIFEEKNVDIVYDLPLIKSNGDTWRFKLKKKIQKNIWPSIINTSSISVKKKYLLKCINLNLFENYNLLEVDFRINAISRCIDHNYLILKDKTISTYRLVPNSIMAKSKKFTKNWWNRRSQAHNFMKMIYSTNNKVYSNFFDSKITNLITKYLIKN
tara:strand:+ start:1795 stop:2577 length:783 start_codon:yes stop_codon:yes gene_type:complete